MKSGARLKDTSGGGAARSKDQDEIMATFRAWRARALQVILVVVALAGLPAWGSVILNAVRNSEYTPLVVIYLVVYLSILTLAVLPRVDDRLRAWVLLGLGYANACASFARLGLVGSGRLYLLATPIFATVLVGARAGVVTTVVSLLIYGIFAALAYQGRLAAWITVMVNPLSLGQWTEAGVALIVFLLSSVVLVERFRHFQMETLLKEHRARVKLEATTKALEAEEEALAQANARLEEYSSTLEEKVEERTAELALAKQKAEAANRRFQQELAFAGRIQASFMSAAPPQIPGWQLAASLIPARETSGDFYDVFPLADGLYGILVADVVDKGVGAALFMSLCWALLHTYALEYPAQPELVLDSVNRRILMDTHADQFVTVFYGVLNPATGTLVYCNAGHLPPYCFPIREDGQVQALSITGIPPGILLDQQWTRNVVQFEPGDVFVLYTDGVTEAQNAQGEFFGRERMIDVVRMNMGCSAEEIQEEMLDEIQRFAGDVPQADDITLVVLVHRRRDKGTGAEAAKEDGADADDGNEE
ncbi:MAG TPA: PP2C family protein-serine/threonine phosphatase [Anaerolineae bacterium]